MTRLLVLVLVACGRGEPEPLEPVPPLRRPPPPSVHGIVLDWNMYVDGDHLRIDYAIKNATDTRITVVDALPVSRKPDYTEIVVRADTTPDAIAFTKALVPPEFLIRHEWWGAPPLPHYRDIPAGGEFRGTARAALPLGAHHNLTEAYAIIGPRTNAVLEIGYYDYADIDASNARSASKFTHPAKLLRGAVKPLPPPARH